MSFVWELNDPERQRLRAQAAEVARTPTFVHNADGTISIHIPALAKLMDPYNVCICPKCLLSKSGA
jgi:hypothetical protein